MTRDPDTPPTAEATLLSISDQMDTAVAGLKEARNAEVEAEHAYRSDLRRALLDPECPKVGTRTEDGERITVAKRDAWAAERVGQQELEWQISKATRKAATDQLNMLRTQASVGQSIASSVRESYRGTGGFR